MFPLSMLGMSQGTPQMGSAMQQVPNESMPHQQQQAGGVSPLIQAMLSQRMGAANGAAQASPMGAIGAASNPVAGALMAQRLGIMK